MTNKSQETEELILEFDKTRILFAEEEVRIVVSLKDVTERRKTEEALKESKEFNKALFDYNPCETIVVDLEGRIVDFNQAKKISGDRLPKFGDLMYKDYAGKHEIDIYSELMECIKSGEIKEFTKQKYGNRFLSIKMSPFSYGAIITSHDITERKKAEEEIRYRLSLEEAISRASRMFIFLDGVDFNKVLKILGEAVSANRAYIFQFRENGSKMDNTYEWCSEGTGPQIDNLQDIDSNITPWWVKKLKKDENIIIQDVSKLPQDATVEKEILQAQDIKSLLVVPIYSREGTLLGFMGFDETEKCREWHEHDAKVLRIISEMISNDFERNRMEQMLIQSEKMASIGILAAGVAHEINNPMGYISSNLRMLLRYYKKNENYYADIQKLIEEYIKEKSVVDKFLELKEDANIDYILKNIKDATEESIVGSEKVAKIVSDLREFAREEEPKIGKADINHGIKRILNIVWNKLKSKADVRKEFGNIPKIECDIYSLEQVFVNILVNAIDAIEKKGIIKIKTFSADNYIVIQISDTGKGIPKREINKIFDPFYTTKAPDKGTGLGLSISYNIIQRHNGKIDVESEVGKGTTFTIKLPVKKYGEIREYKILIVDDDESIRNLLKEMINEYNPSISVKTAKDGFEAGDLLNTFIPDVILLDIKMPEIDGFGVCRRIRTDERMRSTKVVMITGYTAEFSKEDCLEAGAIEFLKKPIKAKTLYKTLDKIIKV